MKLGTLTWSNSTGEGSVSFAADFDKEAPVTRLDALKDWLFDIQARYEQELSMFNREPKQ